MWNDRDGTILGLTSFSVGSGGFRSFPVIGRVSAGMTRYVTV